MTHAARLARLTSPEVDAALVARAEAVAARIQADAPELHRHAPGFSIHCSRCFRVLDEYDRVRGLRRIGR